MIVETNLNSVILDNDFCILYARLTDELLDEVKSNPHLLSDEEFLKFCLYDSSGPNILCLKAYGNAKRGMKRLVKQLIEREHPKTVTFYRDDFERIHYLYGRES
jgi:helix-turn-helix protein